MQENENIKVATKELEEISEDEINQRIAELREKARRDEAAQRMTGERIGRENGIKQAKMEVTKKLLDFGMPTNQISEITGLSVEEIETLSN